MSDEMGKRLAIVDWLEKKGGADWTVSIYKGLSSTFGAEVPVFNGWQGFVDTLREMITEGYLETFDYKGHPFVRLREGAADAVRSGNSMELMSNSLADLEDLGDTDEFDEIDERLAQVVAEAVELLKGKPELIAKIEFLKEALGEAEATLVMMEELEDILRSLGYDPDDLPDI